MKRRKKLLATYMFTLLLTGVLFVLPMSMLFKESIKTAQADYADKYLIKIDVLKKMLTDYKVNHVVFTMENLPEEHPELHLTHLTILNDNGDTTAAIVENGGENGTTLYVYNNNGYTLPAHAPADCSRMFYDMEDLVSVNLEGLSFAQTTDMSEMFWNCSNLTYVFMPADTSRVQTMRRMFENCTHLTELHFKSYSRPTLPTQNVTNFSEMFAGCWSLKNINVQGFDTSSAVNMYMMFYGCSAATSIDVSSFATSNVVSMAQMFYGCSKLTKLDLSNFDTKNVTNFSEMFYNCNELTELDLSNFNTQKATHFDGMFANCGKLTQLDLRSFDTKKATHFDKMFDKCRMLKSLDISNFTFNSGVDITKIRNFVYLPQSTEEAAYFVPLELTIPSDYYKAFQFDKKYVKRKYTEIEGIVANGGSVSIEMDGSFNAYAYVNRKDALFTDPDSQAFLRCIFPDGSVRDFRKENKSTVSTVALLISDMLWCDGFALPIGAKDINKPFTIEFYRDANTKIGGSYRFSVKQYLEEWEDIYCYKIPGYSKTITQFVDAMENYGIYADVYFNQKDIRATDSNPKNYKQSTYDYYVNGEIQYYFDVKGKMIPDENYYGTSLILDGSITLRHYFTERVSNSKESDTIKGLYYLEKSFPPANITSGIDGYDFTVADYVYFVLKDENKDVRLKNLCVSLLTLSDCAAAVSRIRWN